MKQLLLIRHSKSSWEDGGQSDIERPLNNRGFRDAPFMAELLLKKNILPDLIVSSHANRALTTAKTFASTLGYNSSRIRIEESIYHDGIKSLLKLVNNFDDDINCAYMFGHNPTLTTFSNYLSEDPISNIVTTGIVHIKFDIESWKEVSQGLGAIVSYDFPKKHKP